MEIEEKIRKLRGLKGLSQDNMAHELGISQTAYSDIETGATEITVKRAMQISKILGVSLGEIFNFDDRLIFNNHNQQSGNVANIIVQQNEEMVKNLREEIIYLREENGKLLGMLSKKI